MMAKVRRLLICFSSSVIDFLRLFINSLTFLLYRKKEKYARVFSYFTKPIALRVLLWYDERKKEVFFYGTRTS
jgi:hypothetical protein